jgi:hypothetical protein
LKLKRLPQAIQSDTLAEVAGKLASMNQPSLIDYQRLFGPDEIGEVPIISGPHRDAAIHCDFAI